ncbi:MAG: WbqC family protein [candidate division KSB1 bacterium]|nr:WbqC family protein [candidate division KSB1 bacterium]MDZ7276113.1 WbqC family protein [candidate division KSB1 bacterium]MDZ7287107.1 WbqC family protein [candidate division KSB1 bacterium]MDZ7296968.1 WbqC family protein [candidate division KSB1 bacterium]MDZ7306203.1 WbqC family protein [candidate division KSB1 bacterium]
MTCVILQPSYIPWRGYFHQIQKADVFVFYDDVQYDKRGWRNRNRIKSAHGSLWLTIPVHAAGCQIHHTPLNRIAIDWQQNWHEKHLLTLQHAYGKAPFHARYAPLLEAHFQRRPALLADLTIDLTIALARALGIERTRFLRASQFNVTGSKTDRLLAILEKVGATSYLSGPSARAYIEEHKFRERGITLEYMTYDYPVYPQLHPPFDPQVSILDLLFMTGPQAPDYIWGDPCRTH